MFGGGPSSWVGYLWHAGGICNEPVPGGFEGVHDVVMAVPDQSAKFILSQTVSTDCTFRLMTRLWFYCLSTSTFHE